MKPHFACLCLLLLSNHCLGQDSGASEAPSNTPSAEPVQLPQPPTDTSTPGFQLVEDGGARAAAEKYLESKGWSVGWDAAKGWGVYIGVSDLLAADCNGLSLSMEAAVLDAKFQFAEFLGAEASAATLKVADKNPTQRREELDRLDALIK